MKADLLVTGIGQLVRISGSGPKYGNEMRYLDVVDDACLAVANGTVVAAGPKRDVAASVDPETVVDVGGRLVTPGFVDAHTHLVFGGWRHEEYAMRSAGKSYLEIAQAGGGIVSTVAKTRAASEDELLKRSMRFLDRMLANGTTTAEAKSGYGLDLETELKQLRVIRECGRKHPIDLIPTFLGAHAVPPEHSEDREAYVRLVIDMLDEVRKLDLARFVDVFCDRGAFTIDETRRILEAAKALGFGLKVHADELEWTGAAELACELGAVSCEHLLKVSDEGIRMLAGVEVPPIAVLLPATSVFLGKTGAPARELIDRGAAVALGTDFNPGTCTAVSMPLCLTLACSTLHMSPEEAFVAATWNAAWSIGLGGKVGSLSPGYAADMVVFDASDYREVPYRLGWNLVRSVFRRGTEVWSIERHEEDLRWVMKS
ncbi:MAG: imidazolonepropionase [Bacillota bacterium]